MIQRVCTRLLLAGILAGAVESLRAQDQPPPPFPPEAQIAGAAGVSPSVSGSSCWDLKGCTAERW